MKKAYKILMMILVLSCAFSLKALAIDNDGGIVDDVPIDGGLSLLVAAGVGYGVRKLRKRSAAPGTDNK
jgi:hypothetical protein